MRAASLILVLLTVAPASAQADDYLLVFSSDSVPYRPTNAHTFAAVVRAERFTEGPPRLVALTSLSWLPATMKVRGLAWWPEPGRNVPLDETLRTYIAADGQVNVWGPYRIRPELADAFKARVALVTSTFQYRAACLTSPPHVCDCARSVEEMLDPHRRYIGYFGYGAAAASVIVQKAAPWLIEPEHTHPWVATLLGLDCYPLRHRAFGDGTTRHDQWRASWRWR